MSNVWSNIMLWKSNKKYNIFYYFWLKDNSMRKKTIRSAKVSSGAGGKKGSSKKKAAAHSEKVQPAKGAPAKSKTKLVPRVPAKKGSAKKKAMPVPGKGKPHMPAKGASSKTKTKAVPGVSPKKGSTKKKVGAVPGKGKSHMPAKGSPAKSKAKVVPEPIILSDDPEVTLQKIGHDQINQQRTGPVLKRNTLRQKKAAALDQRELLEGKKVRQDVIQDVIGNVTKNSVFPKSYKQYLEEDYLSKLLIYPAEAAINADFVLFFFKRYLISQVQDPKHKKTEIILESLSYRSDVKEVVHIYQNQLFEFEIITSKEDFMKEMKKYVRYGGNPIHKHSVMAQGQLLSNFFYLVYPRNMFGPLPLPDHIGLIEYYVHGNEIRFMSIKPAPPMHAGYLGASSYALIAKQLADRVEAQRPHLENEIKDYFKNVKVSNTQKEKEPGSPTSKSKTKKTRPS